MTTIILRDDALSTLFKDTNSSGSVCYRLVMKPGSDGANQEATLAKAVNAVSNNIAYLGIASPSNAQVVAQMAAITRQTNALIFEAMNTYSDVSGT